MNIQSSLNSAFSMATFLFSQTPKAQEVKEERARQAEIERKRKKAGVIRDVVETAQNLNAGDPIMEAKEQAYTTALSAETSATRDLFEADPTQENYEAYVGSLSAERDWADTLETEASERAEQEAIETQRKAEIAEKERIEAQWTEHQRLARDAITRQRLRGGFDD